MTLEKPPGAPSKLGKYELLREQAGIGAGSTWTARTAEDTSESPKLFSIVRVHKHLIKKQEAADAFVSEILSAADLRHPSVVSVVEVGSADGELIVGTAHHEGETLSALVAAAALPLPVMLRIALDVLGALEAASAHEPPIMHGELGPQYVTVGADGVARVSGFATARALSKLSAPVGPKQQDRISYAAPERVKSMASPTAAAPAPDPRADVFSVGVMLWEGISRQRLFASKIDAAIVQKVLTSPIAALSTFPTITVPDELDVAVQKALERDPQKRSSAAELRAAIEALDADKIATTQQVAELVEKRAGKAIAAREAEIRAALLRKGGKTPSFAPPAATAAGAKAAVARKATLLGMVGPMATKPGVKAPDPAHAEGAPVTPAAPAEAASSPKPPATTPDDPAPASGKKPPAPPKKAAEAEAPKLPEARLPLESQEIEVVDIEVPAAKPAPPKAPPPVPPRKQQATLLMGSPAVAAKPAPPPKPAAAAADDGDKKPAPPPKPAAAAAADGDKKPAATPKPAAAAAADGDKKPAATPKPAAAADADGDKKPAAPARASAEEAKPAPPKAQPAPKPASPSALLEQAANKTSPTPSDGGSPTKGRGPASASVEKVGPGSTLGRYEILMPVARGGMASVWAAKLPGTRGFQKIFAIKTMLPDVSDDPDFESMFLDEGRVAARIRHPNVVEIIDLGEQDDVLYLVMEWVEGENLGSLVKAARPHGGVPLPIVYRLASQICAGLHAAHELRDEDGNLVDLVHRDVSPANVLISTSGFVKIVDFGIAKSKGRLHVTRVGGVVKGKTPYLSPEQLGQLPIDRRSDLFSFGVLLYVLATGLHPFRGDTDSKTIENIALREPVPLRNIIATVPPEFEAIVLKALAKEAKDRWSTAAEMQRAIDQCAATTGAPVTEEDVSAFVRKALGESLTKRAQELRAAVDRAEGRGPDAPEAKEEKGAETKPAPAAAISNPITDEVSFEEDASKPPAKSPIGGVRARSVAETEPELAPGPSPHHAMPPPPPDAEPDAAESSQPASRPAVSSDLDDAPIEVPGMARRRGPVVQIAVGAVLGLCLIIGGVAVFGGSDGKKDPVAHGQGTAAVRTATPTPVPPPTAPATQAATQEPAPAPAPAASSVAAVEPTPPPAETAPPAAPTPAAPTPVAPAGRNTGRNTGSLPTKPAVKPTTKTKKPFNPREI